MRILVIIQGEYGKRIAENISNRGPAEWVVEVWTAPRFLPAIIDEPEEFLPEDLLEADLVLSLGEIAQVGQLLPAVVKRTGAKALIAPVDHTSWLPLGLQTQIKWELAKKEVKIVFPKPFCSLTPVGDESIDKFAEFFGKPELKIKTEDGVIEEVSVKCGAPCGSSWFVAEKLKGVKVEDASLQAGQFHHHYPCLASMQMDAPGGEIIMHLAADLIKQAVEKASG